MHYLIPFKPVTKGTILSAILNPMAAILESTYVKAVKAMYMMLCISMIVKVLENVIIKYSLVLPIRL